MQRETEILPLKKLLPIHGGIDVREDADAIIKRLLSIIILVLLLTVPAMSQQNEINSSEICSIQTGSDQEFGTLEYSISREDASNTDNVVMQPRSNLELYLSLGVLIFGLILIIFTGIVAYKKNSGWDQEANRICVVSVIVTAGLFLMTAGYSDQQVAPMFGLLGTIIGYLLGKSPPGTSIKENE